jgi:hypothetical protein
MVFAAISIIKGAEVCRHHRTLLKPEIPVEQEESRWISMMLSAWRLP